MTTNIGHNSAQHIDVAAEVRGIMSDATKGEGREMKLAVAIWQAPELYNIAALLGGTSHKGKRRAATTAKLAEVSPDFRTRQQRVKDSAKRIKNAKTVEAATKHSFAAADDKNAIAAACQLFERALFSAYWLKQVGAVTVDITGTYADATFAKAFKLDPKDDDEQATDTRMLRIGELRKLGETAWKAASSGKATNRAKEDGKSALASIKAAATIPTVATELGKAIATMPAKAADDFINSDNGASLLAALMRRAFAHEGSIDIDEVAAYIRDNVPGVRVTYSGVPARRKAS